MSTFLNINNALVKPIMDNSSFGIEFNFENKSTTNNPVDQPSARCFLIPVQPNQVALGQDGCDRHDGVFQISLFYPENEGNIAALNKADEIAQTYKSGTVFSFGGDNVTIESIGISQGLNDGPWFVVPITINWYAFIRRS